MVNGLFITSAALPFPEARTFGEIKDNVSEHTRNFGYITGFLYFLKVSHRCILGLIYIFSPTRPLNVLYFTILKS